MNEPAVNPAPQEPGSSPGPALPPSSDDHGAGGEGIRVVRLQDVKKRPAVVTTAHLHVARFYTRCRRRGRKYEHPDGVFGLIREAKTREAAYQVCIDAAKDLSEASSGTRKKWNRAAEARALQIEQERAAAPRIILPGQRVAS